MKITAKIICSSLFTYAICIVHGFFLGAYSACKMPFISGDSQTLHLLSDNISAMREEGCSQENIDNFIDSSLTWYEENFDQAYHVIPKKRLVRYLQRTR